MSDSPYLTKEELAAYYRVPVRTVEYWRELGSGPHGVRVGKYVLYHRDEIARYDAEVAAKEQERAS